MTTFGSKLSEMLEKRDMTYEDLADKVYMSKMAIWHYINKDVLPTADNLKAICQALEVSADYMLGLEVKTSENKVQQTCS